MKEKLTQLLEGLSGFETILMELSSFDASNIDTWAARTLRQIAPGERSVGTITNPTARLLHYVSGKLIAKSEEFKAKAASADSEKEAKEFEEEQYRAYSLAEVIRAWFWVECKAEFGVWNEDIGIRAGWTLVVTKSVNPLADLLKGLGA